jgi:hypothetical protein
LHSRFAGRISFPDYSPEELAQILSNLAIGEGYILPESVREKASQTLTELHESAIYFGNGRAVRNLFGEMKMRLARRLMRSNPSEALRLDKETLTTFSLQDVPGLDPPETISPIAPSGSDEAEYQGSGIGLHFTPPVPEDTESRDPDP